MKHYPLLVVFTLFSLLFLSQCKKDTLITSTSAKLEFSTDTVIFDTVFTTIGSTTQQLKVYNRHNQIINVSSIYLAGGSSSNYRINVDGISTTDVSNIEIPANDSIYIFVEVTLDPNNVTNPMIVTDSIVFITNGNTQDVDLAAWGQDAYFHYNEIISTNTTWANDKPHVVYGFVAVDTTQCLTIPAGTNIYMHAYSFILVYYGGIKVNGTTSDPVIFQGDRLEQYYDNVPGQWDRIWLLYPEQSNFSNTTIRNGTIGLLIDTLAANNPTGVLLDKVIIENMSFAGLYTRGAKVNANNCLIHTCGQFSAAITLGGTYDFRHCTFTNYWSFGDRQDPLFVLNNWYEYNGSDIVRDLDAKLYNCIIYGSNDNEFTTDVKAGAILNYEFNHCIIKTDANISNSTHYNTATQSYKNQDPGFLEPTEDIPDYSPEWGAYLIDKGDPAFSFPDDLNGNPRDASPDLGALEKQ